MKELLNAYKHIKNRLNTRLIIRTKGQAFSFKYGLVGSQVPDRVIDQGIIPVTMAELITKLRLLHKKAQIREGGYRC